MKVAIIPARAGSKRIPLKNIKSFAGKPIIAYSIEVAQASGLFDRIIVSTEDDLIADVARSYGAEVPFMRPTHLADEFTGTIDVVNHAIDWLRSENISCDYICYIYATAPLLKSSYFFEGYNKLIGCDSNFVYSVTNFLFSVQRSVRITTSGTVEFVYPEYKKVRSQDIEELYHDAGQFYWGTPEAFLNEDIYNGRAVPIVLPRHLVQDIRYARTLGDCRKTIQTSMLRVEV